MSRRRLVFSLGLWLLSVHALSAIAAWRVTVATTPTLIYTAPANGGRVVIRNASSVSVFLGPVTTTTATGFEVLAGDAVTLTLDQSAETVYGVVAAGSGIVHVLESRR